MVAGNLDLFVDQWADFPEYVLLTLYFESSFCKRVEFSICHENISHICFVQFLLVGSDTIDEMRNHIPSIPHLGGPSMPDVEMLVPPDVGRPGVSFDAGRPKRGRSDS
jgi:hypothetical protein